MVKTFCFFSLPVHERQFSAGHAAYVLLNIAIKIIVSINFLYAVVSDTMIRRFMSLAERW